MWAFVGTLIPRSNFRSATLPKYQSLPFLLDDISGLRAPALFFVEDGASMILRRLTRPFGVRLHVDQRARRQRDALGGQMRVDLGEERWRQPVPLRQVAEVQDRPSGLRGPTWATVPSDHQECGHRPVRSRQSGASLRCHRASLPPSDRPAHTSSAGNTPGASSPVASAGARPSAPPSGDAAQSAPRDDPTAPPRSALRPNRWRLRLTLRQNLLAPREHLLHRIAKARKGGLFRHRQGSS